MDDDGILAIGGGERENNDQEVSKMLVKTSMQSLISKKHCWCRERERGARLAKGGRS